MAHWRFALLFQFSLSSWQWFPELSPCNISRQSPWELTYTIFPMRRLRKHIHTYLPCVRWQLNANVLLPASYDNFLTACLPLLDSDPLRGTDLWNYKGRIQQTWFCFDICSSKVLNRGVNAPGRSRRLRPGRLCLRNLRSWDSLSLCRRNTQSPRRPVLYWDVTLGIHLLALSHLQPESRIDRKPQRLKLWVLTYM